MIPQTVKKGNRIKVDYTLKLQNGTAVSSTLEDEPMEFSVGDGEVISGLEQAVIDMHEGEMKTLELTSEDAFGPKMDNLIQKIERSQFPDTYEPVVGQAIEIKGSSEEEFVVFVVAVSDTHVKIDANHPLAGKNLILEVRVIEIVS